MAAYPVKNGNTILIGNHENRKQSCEQKVNVSEVLQYNVAAQRKIQNSKFVANR